LEGPGQDPAWAVGDSAAVGTPEHSQSGPLLILLIMGLYAFLSCLSELCHKSAFKTKALNIIFPNRQFPS
jgi:hypothetical protein